MTTTDIARTAAANTPPAAVTIATQVFGIQLDAWVVLLTILYLLLQIAHWAAKLWRTTTNDDARP